MVFRLAHITDLHLTGDPDERPLLESVFISCQKYDVDHVLVTGDISENGEAEAFRLLDEVRREYGFGPKGSTVLIGNHDMPGRRAFNSRFGGDLVTVRDLAGGSLRLIGLDSTARATFASKFFKEPFGYLNTWQLEKVEKALQTSTGKHVIVALHHHVIDVESGHPVLHGLGRPVGLWGPLHDSEELLDLLGQYGGSLVLSGHNHLPARLKATRYGTRIRCDIATNTIEPGDQGVAFEYSVYDFRDGVLIADGHVPLCDTCWESGLVECDTCDDDCEVECAECDQDAEVACEACEGDGTVDCQECDKDGEVPCADCDDDGDVQCGYCKGAGCGHCDETGFRSCNACNGHGWLTCGACDDNCQVGCKDCGGSGYFECDVCEHVGFVACPDCEGEGALECPDCE